MTTGNYYITAKGDPYYNMALDEWAFKRVLDGGSAVLRLYSWNRGAVTFGFNQKIERAVDRARLKNGTPVIRRITGGRAIYHDSSEVTFGLALNMTVLPKHQRSLAATNTLISSAQVDILARLGYTADWLDHSDRNFISGVKGRMKSCFGSVSKYEVVGGFNKIAGGAQRRIGDCLIHQGSIKINGVSACEAIGQEASPPQRDAESAQNLGGNYTIDHFTPIFGAIFGAKLGISFERSDFLPDEVKEIEKIRVDLIKNCLEKR
ncbi:MAG: hypothetical protein DRP46_10300 [Candidatus Zixiibacteriota bacterium]|nr:MAG: hypothetical protein DRP46_10300 [candidate division Zixibacteria bacterium]HDL04218.1 lipoate--protein ligase family protein [candidate division Zixibacteria bacterium]